MTLLMWLLVFGLVIAAIAARLKRSAKIVVFRTEDPRILTDDSRRVGGTRESNVEQMVSCSSCGIYIPASEAVFYRNKVYCCEDHMA